MACGQDPACVVEGHIGIARFEQTDKVYNSLLILFFFAFTSPFFSYLILISVNNFISINTSSGRLALFFDTSWFVGGYCGWGYFVIIAKVPPFSPFPHSHSPLSFVSPPNPKIPLFPSPFSSFASVYFPAVHVYQFSTASQQMNWLRSSVLRALQVRHSLLTFVSFFSIFIIYNILFTFFLLYYLVIYLLLISSPSFILTNCVCRRAINNSIFLY